MVYPENSPVNQLTVSLTYTGVMFKRLLVKLYFGITYSSFIALLINL